MMIEIVWEIVSIVNLISLLIAYLKGEDILFYVAVLLYALIHYSTNRICDSIERSKK